MDKCISIIFKFILIVISTFINNFIFADTTDNICGLTLPFQKGTHYTIGDRFDISLNSRRHVGTDLLVNKNGIDVVAPESGKIVWLGPDPNGGWGMDVKTNCEWGYGVFHFTPIKDLKVGMDIKRGQYIGKVNFPKAPHIHMHLLHWEENGLYFVDIFPQSGTNCVRWKFNKQGNNQLIKGYCSPGYWLGNAPQYP